jgi:hypothetical protein
VDFQNSKAEEAFLREAARLVSITPHKLLVENGYMVSSRLPVTSKDKLFRICCDENGEIAEFLTLLKEDSTLVDQILSEVFYNEASFIEARRKIRLSRHDRHLAILPIADNFLFDKKGNLNLPDLGQILHGSAENPAYLWHQYKENVRVFAETVLPYLIIPTERNFSSLVNQYNSPETLVVIDMRRKEVARRELPKDLTATLLLLTNENYRPKTSGWVSHFNGSKNRRIWLKSSRSEALFLNEPNEGAE